MSGFSGTTLKQQYKLLTRCCYGIVKIQDLKTGLCHRLPVNRLLQFPEIMEAFSVEDRASLYFLAKEREEKQESSN